jgi:hypothetical protein
VSTSSAGRPPRADPAEYTVERGERLPAEPIALFGFRKWVVENRAPLHNHDLPDLAAEYGQPPIVAGELAKSALFVPMITGGSVKGILLIENLEREDAFSESDLRLLTTLAGGLGVALENARLFDQTKKLLSKPMSAPPSSPSSTTSSARCPRTSTFRRCTTSSATRSRRSSMPRSSTSGCTTSGPHSVLVHDRARRPLPE